MQTLWSRIATVRGATTGCRCPQCIPSTSGISRRAGATATRRAPKYLTSSTLLYSGIFATAATFDAGVKQQRRDKWDQAIAEVKHELGAEGAGQVDVEKEEVDVGEYVPFGGGVLRDEGFRDGGTSGEIEDEADVFADVRPTGPRPQWPTNTGTPLQPWHLAPESIYAPELRRATLDGRAWSPKKVEMISLSVDMLQMQIFLEMQARGGAEEAAQSVPEDYGSWLLSPWSAIKTLRALRDDYRSILQATSELEGYSRGTPLTASLTSFARGSSDESPIFHIPHSLNNSLRSLFQSHQQNRLSTPSLLAQICHSISVSASPPNLDTFNTLLLGFSACKESSIVRHTIDSLRQCNLRPNEVTLSTILNFYTTTKDPTGFANWVELMRGRHGGLALARPDVNITAECEGRLVPKDNGSGKIIQLPYPTPKVFASLVKGVVKFSGFESALGICKNLGEEGWGLCMSGLGPLLRDCADRGDWTSGLGVWEQIRALEAKAKRRVRGEQEGFSRERIPVRVCADMIRLCLKVRERTMYDEVWALATREHRHHAQVLTGLVKWPNVREKVLRAQQRVRSAEVESRGGAEFENASVDGAALMDDLSVEDLADADQNSVHTDTDRPRDLDRAESTTAAVMRARRRLPEASQQELTMEHLHGSLAGNYELDEYEAVERPMSGHG